MGIRHLQSCHSLADSTLFQCLYTSAIGYWMTLMSTLFSEVLVVSISSETFSILVHLLYQLSIWSLFQVFGLRCMRNVQLKTAINVLQIYIINNYICITHAYFTQLGIFYLFSVWKGLGFSVGVLAVFVNSVHLFYIWHILLFMLADASEHNARTWGSSSKKKSTEKRKTKKDIF